MFICTSKFINILKKGMFSRWMVIFTGWTLPCAQRLVWFVQFWKHIKPKPALRYPKYWRSTCHRNIKRKFHSSNLPRSMLKLQLLPQRRIRTRNKHILSSHQHRRIWNFWKICLYLRKFAEILIHTNPNRMFNKWFLFDGMAITTEVALDVLDSVLIGWNMTNDHNTGLFSINSFT